MRRTSLIFRIVLITIISLSFGILLPNSTAFSQSHLRVNEDIGGGSNGGQQADDSNSSAVFIVGGLIVVGVVAYFLLTRDRKNEGEETENSSDIKTLNQPDYTSEFNDFEHELEKAKDNFPVDFTIGISNTKAFVSDKTYLMGVSVRF